MNFARSFAITIALYWGTSSVVLGACDLNGLSVNGVSDACCSDQNELYSKNGGALAADLADCALESQNSCISNPNDCTIDYRTFYFSKPCVDKSSIALTFLIILL
jgi:hypothetical protein